MNTAPGVLTVPLGALEEVAARALRRHGTAPFAAAEVAHAIARAEQVGNPHCGLAHLALDCRQLRSGRVDGAAVAQVRSVRPGLVQVDAHDGFAQPAFMLGLPAARQAMATLGVAVLAVRRAYTGARLGYFAERLAQQGCIGLVCTNASASVAAPGGSARVLGTNPVALAVPDGDGGIAFQFDQCTSAANLRQVREAAARGETLPPGCAVTADGEPTIDAQQALAGALLPAGGARGFGFALMAEVLAAFFTDSAMSMDTPALNRTDGPPHGLGLFCLLLDPAAIAGERFWQPLGRLRDAIAAQPGARLPGTRRPPADDSAVTVSAAAWHEALALAGPQD